jgi:hypothetical protein
MVPIPSPGSLADVADVPATRAEPVISAARAPNDASRVSACCGREDLVKGVPSVDARMEANACSSHRPETTGEILVNYTDLRA